MTKGQQYLPDGLPIPVVEADGLSQPYWDGLKEENIRIQRCHACNTWQWGPEWICHHCHAFDLDWGETAGRGRIYSWERSWHPVHPALKEHGPYIVVLVELPEAGNIRMIGNLLGEPTQDVRIGAEVRAVFEHHTKADPPYTLLQWRYAEG